MSYKQGFTLLELLIVMAVIVILVSIFVPSLLSARNKAHDTATLVYGRAMLTSATSWLADSPLHTVANLQADCLYSEYIAEGAASIFPVSVSACEVQQLGTDLYGVKVTSRTGKVFELRN